MFFGAFRQLLSVTLSLTIARSFTSLVEKSYITVLKKIPNNATQ